MVTIGCTAEILNVIKKYPDGRMNILAEGKKRFEVLQVNSERAFLRADVFYLHDEDDPAAPTDIEKAIRLHQEIMKLAGAQPEEIAKSETAQLTYRLARYPPLRPDLQQTATETTSE